MRNAARRGERADFTLGIAITGRPSVGGPVQPGGPPLPPGSGPVLSPGNMPAYCRGEAASLYGTRPTYVRTGRLVRGPNATSIIDGTVDKGVQG